MSKIAFSLTESAIAYLQAVARGGADLYRHDYRTWSNARNRGYVAGDSWREPKLTKLGRAIVAMIALAEVKK